MSLSPPILDRRRQWQEWVRRDAPQGSRSARAAIARNNQQDAQWLSAVTTVQTDAGRALAEATRAAMVGPAIPWGVRTKLMNLGMSLGLSRFDASLIIASVQHRMQKSRPKTPVLTRKPAPMKRKPMGSIVTLVCLALALEALAVAAWLAW
ncbi:MAG: hypothetical protein QM770_04045 [Tepidisphaeraceae bacterium]